MRTLVFVFLSTLALQVQAQSEAAINARVDATLAAFEQYDAKAFSTHFTADAVVVNPLGMIFHGSEELYTVHKNLFEQWGTPPATKSEITHREINHLAGDLAMVTQIEKVSGDPKAGEGAFSYSFLLKEVKGAWLIQFAQVTPVVDMPGMPMDK